MSEDKLIKKAKKGDKDSFGQLYDKHLPAIYRFVFLKVGHKTEAEDITQQVFLNALENIKTFTPQADAKFSSWLYKIAKNLVIDHYRTAKGDIDVKLVSDKLQSNEDLESALDKDLRFEIVKNALQHLTDDEQNVILMKFVNELSGDEIAAALQKSHGAIRVVQHRALKKLKKHLYGNKENG